MMQLQLQLVHKYESISASGKASTTVVIGEVTLFHILEGVLDRAGTGEGKPTVKLNKLKPIARVGGDTYVTLGTQFDLPRPDRKA
jgi:flavin reductase (DIM6/NTAB) family NADH-FMN oxidoreductase RutF